MKLVFHTLGRTQAEVFENRVLRNIYRPEGKEVKEDWRKMHSEELHDVHSSSIIMVIKSRKMRWAGHAVPMEDRNTEYWWRNRKERDHFEDQCICGKII